MKNVKQELLKKGFNSEAALANVYLAEFYEENSQPEQGLVYVLESQLLLSTEKNIINLYINSKTLYRLLKKDRKGKGGNNGGGQVICHERQFDQTSAKGNHAGTGNKIRNRKKEKDIAILNTENQLSELKLSKERNLLSKERSTTTILLLKKVKKE